jgi:hypothetical protein
VAERAGLCLEHDGDGAVVLDLDEHSSAEDAARDARSLSLERLAEALVERLGGLRARCAREARTVALRRVF